MLNKKLDNIHFWVLTVGGLLGMVAMTWQASERISMLKNPSISLNCNLSPVIDCGTVLGNKLAALFGFPNAFIGMIVFAMLALAGIAGITGVKFTKNFKNVVLSLATILIMFSMWFFAASLYSIGKICIFCVVGWIVSVPIFVYSLISWLSDKKDSKLLPMLQNNHLVIILAWYVVLFLLFLFRFREYYFN
jgi:uncharacterized membrane protein